MKRKFLSALALLAVTSVVIYSCSKGGGGDDPPVQPDACAGTTITIGSTITVAGACQSNGGIIATASGSTGFTYSIDNNGYQASGTFTNLPAGSYKISAKDGKGCIGTANVTVTSSSATPGPLFLAVKNLISANCQSCHNSSNANGGMNWAVDCNIVIYKARIKARAVDNTPSSMPPSGPLAQADKDKITAWFNAGGEITN